MKLHLIVGLDLQNIFYILDGDDDGDDYGDGDFDDDYDDNGCNLAILTDRYCRPEEGGQTREQPLPTRTSSRVFQTLSIS